MHEPVAAEQPSSDSTRDDAVRLREPPGDLGRAYRIAFAETGALEVVLPATEQVPAQVPAPTPARQPAAARSRARAVPVSSSAPVTVPVPVPVPVQRSAPTEVLSTTPPRTAPARGTTPGPGAAPAHRAVPLAGSGPSSHLQLARRSRALLLGVALGVLLGVAAVVVTGMLVASLGLLPR